MHWEGNNVLRNLLAVSWAQLLSVKPIDQLRLSPARQVPPIFPGKRFILFANLLEMKGCTLFKGGRDVTEPLAFVRLIKAIPSEGVYVSV